MRRFCGHPGCAGVLRCAAGWASLRQQDCELAAATLVRLLGPLRSVAASRTCGAGPSIEYQPADLIESGFCCTGFARTFQIPTASACLRFAPLVKLNLENEYPRHRSRGAWGG
jgi:hypothetical protein